MIDFRDMNLKEIEVYMDSIGEKRFRAKQVFKWVNRGVQGFEEMTNLPVKLRERLAQDGFTDNMSIAARQESKLDGTIKYLMRLRDGNLIECVLMRYSYGNSICISTQAGCSMGCSFCASTIGGKNRNLTSGELLGQILRVQRDIEERVSNIVLMGTGEPLDNFDNVIKFLELVNDSSGLNIGMRHITLSTCGLVPEIKRLADINLQITLAVSLHAPNDVIRTSIMPVARKYSYRELLDACRYYADKTGRRVTFEYALIEGVNDREEDAIELSNNLKGILCHVNLIPLNSVRERNYRKSRKDAVVTFRDILTSRGVETTVRRELGSDIDAACGQLRRGYSEDKE